MLLSVVGVLEFGLSPLVAAEWHIVMTFMSVVSKRAACGVVVGHIDTVWKELLECDVLSVELVAVMLAEPEVETTVTSVVDGLEFELSPLAAVE